MDEKTFTNRTLYKITKHGRTDGSGGSFMTRKKGSEPVWFVGLVWRKKYHRLNTKYHSKGGFTDFYLVASNYYHSTETIKIMHSERGLKTRDRIKIIEPFRLCDLPLLVGTKPTTLFDILLTSNKSDITTHMEKLEKDRFYSDI